MTPLLDLRFVVVSGKGGVGRTTVAAALATAAAAAGKRALIAQTATAERLGRMFGRPGPIGPAIVTLAPGVDAVNMTAQSAIHEYALMVLRSELVYRALFENRAVRGFLGAVPGLDAYSMLGKAWWHTTERVDRGRPRYDMVILDAPASGHATLMLRIPQAILDAAPKGPLSRDARAIRDLLSDPRRTALVIVTLAEELPVREAAELAAAARGPLKLPLGPMIVNGLPSNDLEAPAVAAVLDRLAGAGSVTGTGGVAGAGATTGDPGLDTTLRLAAGVRAHRRIAEEMLDRLRRNPGLPLVTLPRLPTAEMGPREIAALAERLTKAAEGLNVEAETSDVGREVSR
jgi:anion-transporting  ArsA/GET3 family ATPase